VVSRNEDRNDDVKDFENGCDDCNDRDENIPIDASVLLKNVSSVFFSFASCSNSFFLFLFL